MILNNKTQDWKKEARRFSSFFEKAKGLMFKKEISKPAVFPLDREKVSIWNFMVFVPFLVVSIDENKRVKEKITFPRFPKLKIKWFKDGDYLIEDALTNKGKYELGDEIEFGRKDL